MAALRFGASLPYRMVPTPMTTAEFHEEWFGAGSQQALQDMCERTKDIDGIVVEFGAWEGRSSVALANAAYPKVVHSVDPWDGRGHPMSAEIAARRDIGAQWAANMAAHTKGNYVGHRMGWEDFVPTITEPIALCFIDADHSYRAVFDNLAAILPLMAPGGVVCGDDMHHGPVQDAVFDLLGMDDVYFQATVWIWRMPTDRDEADRVLLRARSLALAPTGRELGVHIDKIARLYRHYVGAVSPQEMAASPATVAYLHHLCTVLRPNRVLDLGSGLSSAVLRKYQQEQNPSCEVVTVDDDSEWLEKTRKFLIDNELSAEQLCRPGDVKGEFDLVFHDMNGGEVRERAAAWAMRMARPGGVIVLDDAHRHGDAYRKAAAAEGVDVYSLKSWTIDQMERHAALGIKSERTTSDLAAKYEEQCATPSDIYLHLPRFARLVVEGDAKKVIELGTRTGVSTIAWLYALEQTGGHLWSVDIDRKPPIGDYPHWTFIQGDDEADEVLAQLPTEVDILFLDTSHHFQHTLRELRLYRSQVRSGGLIVCHDTELPVPEGAPAGDPVFPVKRAIEQFVAETGFRWLNIPECWGLAIIEVV